MIANARLVRFGEAFSKLAKYERDSGKWKMPRNVATYAAIPIPQRARADEELTLPLAWWRNSEPCSVARLGGFPAVLNLIVRVILAWAAGQNLGCFLVSLAVFKTYKLCRLIG